MRLGLGRRAEIEVSLENRCVQPKYGWCLVGLGLSAGSIVGGFLFLAGPGRGGGDARDHPGTCIVTNLGVLQTVP